MFKTSRFVTLIFAFSSVLSLASVDRAVAMPGKAAWIGGMYGLVVPNASNTSSRSAYGITGGAKLGDEYGLGAYFLSSQKDEDTSTGKSAFNYDLYGVEFTYHFEGEAAGVYFGGRIGTSKMKSGLVTTSPMNLGAVVGFNKMLLESLSVGGDLSYMSISSSSGSPAGGGQSVPIDQFTSLNFLATLKLWF